MLVYKFVRSKNQRQKMPVLSIRRKLFSLTLVSWLYFLRSEIKLFFHSAIDCGNLFYYFYKVNEEQKENYYL